MLPRTSALKLLYSLSLVAVLCAACSTTKPDTASKGPASADDATLLGPYGVVSHPKFPLESLSLMRADVRQLATEGCQRHRRVPEWLSEEFFDNPTKPGTPMILLMVYCVEPGSHTTEEQKQARIAALRDAVAKGHMTQAEFNQALPVVLSEP
jgi:hypothetical protein